MRHLIKIAESAFDYASLSPEELQSIAMSEDDNSDGQIKADECAWSYDPAFPLEQLVGLMRDSDWAGWLKDEVAMDHEEELSRNWSVLQNEDIHTPIIVATDGVEPQIWNGWHRTAGQIVRGAQTIPAIVGVKRGGVNEAFMDGFEVTSPTGKQMVEVYRNPSRKEFDTVWAAHQAVRGFIGDDIFIWDAMLADHGMVANKFGIAGLHAEWRNDGLLVINWYDQWNGAYGYDDFDHVKRTILENPAMKRLLIGFEVVRS